MSEAAEIFGYMKKRSAEKRADNRDSSAQLLSDRGIEFEEKNYGAHLIVRAGKHVADFWPGTGLWIVRGNGARRRGVFPLIKWAKKEAQS